MRGAHGDWYDGLCVDVMEEDGHMKYALALDNGDTLKIAIDDVCEILETKRRYRIGDCAVLPFRREKRKA